MPGLPRRMRHGRIGRPIKLVIVQIVNQLQRIRADPRVMFAKVFQFFAECHKMQFHLNSNVAGVARLRNLDWGYHFGVTKLMRA